MKLPNLQNLPLGRPRRPVFTGPVVSVDFTQIEKHVLEQTLDREVLDMLEILPQPR